MRIGRADKLPRYGFRRRDCPSVHTPPDPGDRGRPRRGRRASAALRPRDRQGLHRRARRRAAGGSAQAGAGVRHHADPGRRGQDHHHHRPRPGLHPARRIGLHGAARAQPRALHGRQGRGLRWRLLADHADGPHQPALYRRFPRDHHRQQPDRGDGRQPHPLRQRAGRRPAPGGMAPRDGHERPHAARHRDRPGRPHRGHAARGRFRHHRGLGGHGDALPGQRPRRPARTSRPHAGRLHLRQGAGLRRPARV